MSISRIIRAIRRRIRKYSCKIYAATIAKRVPIQKNKVYVDNFIGKGYGGNPQYVVDEILRRKLDWDIVWAVNDIDTPMPNGVRKVEYGTIACAREQASAGIWIDNVRNAHLVRKRQGQIYLQTWHGAFGFKSVEKFAEDQLSDEYIEAAKYDGSITDGILAENKFKMKQYENGFWLSKKTEVLKVGVLEPEYNLSVEQLDSKKNELRNQYGIDKDTFLILYAPTFRNVENVEVYNLDFKRVLDSLEKKTGKSCKLIVRFHPNVNVEKVKSIIDKNDNRILDGRNFPCEVERYIISDMLITDYSAVMYFFSLLHKPVFIYAKDYEEYKKERSLILEIKDVPYPFAQSIEEFEKCVADYDELPYFEKINEFYKKLEVYKVDNPAGKVVEWLITRIG